MKEIDGRRARGDKARAGILAQSIKLAATEGLEGVTIGRLATAAGVGKANISVLFGSKEELQLATLERAAQAYQSAVIAPSECHATPLEKLKALVEGWFHFIENKTLPGGCFMSAIASEYRARPGRIQDWVNDYRAGTRSQFRRLIVEAKDAGELLPTVDEDQLAFELFAAQGFANAAELLGNHDEFQRSRDGSMRSISSAMTAKAKRRASRQAPNPGAKAILA